MSRTRWALSAWLVWHLFAMALTALPNAERVPAIGPQRHPTDDRVAERLTPVLDSAAAVVLQFSGALTRTLGPVRDIAGIYLRTLGINQNWSMFWNPPRDDLYVRLRYHVVSARATSSWSATELIYPALPEYQPRLWAFRLQHRDKAILSMLVNFQHRRDNTRPVGPEPEFPPDLAPIAGYFSRLFASRALQSGERIARVEVWSAATANAGRGERLEPAIEAARHEVLRAYYDAPVEKRLPAVPTDRRAVEREADLVWFLDYYVNLPL